MCIRDSGLPSTSSRPPERAEGAVNAPRCWRTKPRSSLCVRRPDPLNRFEGTVLAPAIRDSRGPPKVCEDLRPAHSEHHSNPPAHPGDYMATSAAPSREDFAAMLDESFHTGNLQEGAVIKGTVVAVS